MVIENHDFLGEESASSDDERVCVVPLPLEFTTSYAKGTAAAPEAILDASKQIELYNIGSDFDLEGSGIITLDPGVRERKDLASFLEENRERLLASFTCFIGGEHSITPWILEGMKYGEIGIVWLDAHADLRDEYMGDSESHACAARNSLRFGSIVEIGVRSCSVEEMEFIRSESRVKVFRRFDDDAADAVKALPPRVYLSLDFDSIDPAVIRSVGTPEPGGLAWEDLIDILDLIFATKEVVGMDAVELCPSRNDHTSDFIAAKAIYEAITRSISGKVIK